MSDYNTFPYRRATDPIPLVCAPTQTRYDLTFNIYNQQYTSFMVVNCSTSWVRLRGSGNASPNSPLPGTFTPVTDATGWLFPPGFCGVFTTQFPLYLSSMSVTRQGITADPAGVLEISYGGGA